jgi:hypothetical protein
VLGIEYESLLKRLTSAMSPFVCSKHVYSLQFVVRRGVDFVKKSAFIVSKHKSPTTVFASAENDFCPGKNVR